jgi:imidazole glycerol-phosphate synthase subunit HisH
MSQVLGIVNYGVAGNTYSIKKTIEAANGIVKILSKPDDFKKVDKLIIPGVGSYRDAMKELNDNKFIDSILKFNGAVLGICLGMQLLSKIGYEYGETKGLGILNSSVKKISCDGKIPHVGFNKIKVIKNNMLLKGIENEEFYFMHSYELISSDNVVSTTDYNGYKIISSIQKRNFYGVQFHPEKSRGAGIHLFTNFIEL